MCLQIQPHFAGDDELQIIYQPHGPLARYENCGLRMRRECRERFPRQPTSKETAS